MAFSKMKGHYFIPIVLALLSAQILYIYKGTIDNSLCCSEDSKG